MGGFDPRGPGVGTQDSEPPSTDEFDFNIPQDEESEPILTPIGFDSDTGRALLEGDTNIPTTLRGSERTSLPGSSGGVWRPTERDTLYYDVELDGLTRGFGAERTKELQSALVHLGFISDSKVIEYGSWDNDSKSAFRELLAVSNRSGTTWDLTLRRMLANPDLAARREASRPSGPTRAPFRARLPDRDEVKRVYRTAAIRTLGGRFDTEADEDVFADTFEKQVVAAQRAAYDGQTVREAPSAGVEAEEQIENTRGDEVDANRFAGYVRVLEDLIG